mgnify:CR=1 FL=1
MKRKKWEQFVENKKNDSVVKVSTIQEEYEDDDKTMYIYDYETEEYFKNKRS